MKFFEWLADALTAVIIACVIFLLRDDSIVIDHKEPKDD